MTRMASQQGIMFRHKFGLRPGMRCGLYSEEGEYSSLPPPLRSDSQEQDYQSLQSDCDPGKVRILTKDLVTITTRDTNNNNGADSKRSVSPVDREVSLGRLKPSGLPLRTSIPSLSTSKDSSSPSPSSSSSSNRSSLEGGSSRIPISKSQDDLVRNVTLRRESKDSVGSKLRPTSYRCPGVTNGSPRNSKLMSRNSVEVLTYSESQKNNSFNETGARKYHSQNRVNNKHEATSKFTKKFGSRDSSLNIYQKNPKLQKTGGLRNVSLIPQPAAVQSSNKKSSVQPSSSKKQGSTPTTPSISKQSGPAQQKSSLSCNNSSPNLISSNKEKHTGTKRLSNESIKSDDRIRANNAKNTANTSRLWSKDSKATPPMITERKPDRSVTPSSPSRKLAQPKSRTESAQKVLSEQLLRGKVPPKAKFRADDEISIGEPCEEREEVSETSEDAYLPSKVCLEVARCLEEGGRTRDQKTNSLPLNSCLEPGAAAGKSTSLSNYYKAEKLEVGRSTSEGFFQRLSNLRRSFNSYDNKRSSIKIRPHLTANSPFFRGISEVKKSSRPLSGSKVNHSHNLVIKPIIKSYKPPVRKYQFQRSFPIKKDGQGSELKRSFSFSDAQIIAQSVDDGERKVISDLYPAFQVSESLYCPSEGPSLSKNDSTSITSNKHSQVGRDTNSSEQTVNITRPVKGDGDNKENRRESIGSQLLDGSQVTLTSSIVNIRNAAGSLKKMDGEDEKKSPQLSTLSTVTNISVSSENQQGSLVSNTSPVSPKQNPYNHSEDLSPLISPWSGTSQVVRVVSDSSSLSQPHPFIYRVQNQLTNSPPLRTEEQRTPDPFKKILAAADDNICQAESILSSLGYDGTGISRAEPDSEEDSPGLGSDIETNIRRLEKTQAKINAALQTFRNVQNKRINSSDQSFDDKNLSFCSLPAHDIEVEKFKKPEALSVTAEISKTERSEKTGGKKSSIIRRHSFNNLASKEKSPVSSRETSQYNRESLCYYDGDNDSETGGHRTSSVFDDASDTEGSYSPFKNRIRGLFGSFGKGKKQSSRLTADDSFVNGDKKLITIEYPDSQSGKEGTFSIGHFTELVKSLPAHNFSGRESPQSFQSIDGLNEDKNSQMAKKPTFIRPRDPDKVLATSRTSKNSLCHNNSSDTYSSVSTSQSMNLSSNRNSVISTQSNSSSSYEQDPGSVSDNEHGERTSSTSPKDPRPEYIASARAQERKVYYIAKEIMTSEKTYVDVLKLINIDFRDFVQKARLESKSGILPDHDFVKLFSNLPELMMLNEDLLRDFEDRVANWDRHKKIADVIIKKGPYLKLYTVYIRDFSAMNFHFDEVCQRYPKFGKLVKEFERQPRCQNLKLKHFMLKPVQRLPQYKLLLEDYLKHLDQDSEDFDDTTLALKIVSDAAEHANNTVKQGDKFQAMLKLQSRLGDWEFIRPGRDLVKEGELQKINRKGVTSRYFALLSDTLLYCSYQGSWAGENTGLKVGYTIPLNQLEVGVPTAEDYQNEFSITSNVRSCTLRARSVQERNDWLDALNSAIEDYRSRKATFVSLDQISSPLHVRYKLGDSAPVWTPDTRVTMCQSCSCEFSLVSRRHHCRACGKVVCAPCSANKAPLKYRQFEASRVCDSCYDALEKVYGDDIDLRTRFKRRDVSRSVGRFVPQRLKLSANSEGSQVSGYLRHRKSKNSRWKRCWFVLKDRVLYTYRASEDTVATDTLPVLGWSVTALDQKDLESFDSLSSYQVFTLSHPGSQTLLFCAENENSTDRWIGALREAVSF